MKVEHDVARDVAYFEIGPGDAERQVKLDDVRIVDYGADGTALGVEFIGPSRGLDLEGVPHAPEIARAARRHGLRIQPRRRTSRAS